MKSDRLPDGVVSANAGPRGKAPAERPVFDKEKADKSYAGGKARFGQRGSRLTARMMLDSRKKFRLGEATRKEGNVPSFPYILVRFLGSGDSAFAMLVDPLLASAISGKGRLYCECQTSV